MHKSSRVLAVESEPASGRDTEIVADDEILSASRPFCVPRRS